MKLMIDLFSGLGGASEAFVLGPHPWAVLRYENNPALANTPYTTLCDLTDFDIHIRHQVDLIWASPPCREFSNAFNAPAPTAQREGRDFEPSLELLSRAIEIIEELEPTYWIIENVIGAIKHFEPLLGEPRQIIGSFVLWGNFPFIDVDRDLKHTKASVDVWSDNPLRANIKGKIPIELSQALRRVCEQQTTLTSW